MLKSPYRHAFLALSHSPRKSLFFSYTFQFTKSISMSHDFIVSSRRPYVLIDTSARTQLVCLCAWVCAACYVHIDSHTESGNA